GDRCGSSSGGHANQLAARPARCSPLFSRARPSRENVGVASSPVTGSVTGNCLWSLPAARLMTCHLLVTSADNGKALLDEDADRAFVEPAREFQLVFPPRRAEPCLADQEQHGLAPPRSLVERALPTLAGGDAPFGIKVQKQVVPALANKPIAQRNGW